MANENNNNGILRPSQFQLLNDNHPPLNIQAPPFQPIPIDQQNLMRNMIENAVREQTEEIRRSLQTETVSVRDEVIEERYRENIGEIDKIPDIVRLLKEFSGNPNEFSSWKKSVDRILQIYDSSRGTPRYFGIMNVIRNKITGNADIVLESYNTPLNWHAICKCLTLHYADKRDISTLEFQLMSMRQGYYSLEDFYQSVYDHLSLILNKIACMEIDASAISLLTKSYRDKALDTFIRGLNGDLLRLLATREPIDLPKALYLCQKIGNQSQRTVLINSSFNQFNITPRSAQIRPRQQQQQKQQTQYHKQNQYHQYQHNKPFYPQLAHYTQQNIAQPYNIPPPRPTAPKPRLYEPMEVDGSLQTKKINYMNRPIINQQNPKRPASSFANLQKIGRQLSEAFGHGLSLQAVSETRPLSLT